MKKKIQQQSQQPSTVNKTLPIVVGIILVGVLAMGIWSFFQKTASSGTDKFTHISAKDAYTLIQEQENNKDFVVLDVRTSAEFQQGHIKSAKNIDFYANTFRGQLEQLDKEKTYLLYCRSGNRSGKTLAIMEKMGFQKAYNMLGGVGQWAAQELPLTR